MGDWRRVRIVGTCGEQDICALSEAIDAGDNYDNLHCLCHGGVCGLPPWASTEIDVIGNLAERDYEPEDVAEALQGLLAKAPSLSVKVHVGGSRESTECVATVSVGVTVGKPEVDAIPELTQVQIDAGMRRAMGGY